jgi:putative flippase GtrA
MRSAGGLTHRRLLGTGSRYLQVGLLCAGLNNAIVSGLAATGTHYAVGLVLAFVLVTALAYRLHAQYTFAAPFAWGGLARFYGANLAGFAISAALMALLCSGLGLSATLAMPLVTMAMVAWNLLSARWATARR